MRATTKLKVMPFSWNEGLLEYNIHTCVHSYAYTGWLQTII